MRILIVTDAWAPQVNGVVRTLQATVAGLERRGHTVAVISPDRFRSLPCPSYPEIRLALAGQRQVGRLIEAFAPDALHIATEGPLGVAARGWCLRRGYGFTTVYHTHFAQYLHRRTRLPARWFWRYIRWFHAPATAILVSTPTIAGELAEQELPHTRQWGRGVDLAQFTPDQPPPPEFADLARPILLYVGRVAVEKNIEAFLALDGAGTKVVVGGGPQWEALRRDYPDVRFLGPRHGAQLAGAYAGADAFVFPSRTDTFGLVMIEALACGAPVAAFPVSGPREIVGEAVGCLAEDLAQAVAAALTKDRTACVAHAARFGWDRATSQFESALVAMADAPPVRARFDRGAVATPGAGLLPAG